MKGILADINSDGHWQLLVSRLESDRWSEIWNSFGLVSESFPQLGLPYTAPDSVVWKVCQERQLLLITSNRNADGPDSLEMTIRAHNTDSCLPVFTLADAARVKVDKPYAERVVEKLLEYLLDIEKYLGTGRLYLP
jgi:hypothetical protein